MAIIEYNDDSGLNRLKKMFEECRDQTQTARDQAAIDADYYHGAQWSASEIAELKRRRQPVITYNLIKNKISTICGVEENSKTDPKAFPRTPRDEDAANVATDVLKYVCDTTRFSQKRIEVFEDTLICGVGGCIVEVEEGQERPEINIRRLRYENIVYDPYSRERDFSDARYVGIATWFDEEEAVKTFGEDSRQIIEDSIDDQSVVSGSDTYEDRPKNSWSDRKRRRLLVVELYHNETDGWNRSVFVSTGILSSGLSEYSDADGKPACPILLTSCYVDRDNNRYGLVRDMRSPQDEINHRRSKLLHLLNTRQTFRKEGAIASRDPQTMRRELNKPDGDVVITKNATWGQDVGIIETGSLAQGQADLLVEAKGFIDQIGPNNALSGVGTETQSGRAILAQQQAGMAMLATVFAAHNDWILCVYRQIWARARQFWTAPMYIRVTDNMDSVQFIYVNEMIETDPETGYPLPQPMIRNRIAEMGVDLEVERVPHSANLQAEQFDQIGQVIQNPEFRTPEVFAAWIANSILRDKKVLIEAVQPKPPDPAMVQLQQRGAMAEIAEKEGSAMEKMADAQLKQIEAAVKAEEVKQVQAQNAMLGMQPNLPQQPAPQQMPQDMGQTPPEQIQQQMMEQQPPPPPFPQPPQPYGEAVPLQNSPLSTLPDGGVF